MAVTSSASIWQALGGGSKSASESGPAAEGVPSSSSLRAVYGAAPTHAGRTSAHWRRVALIVTRMTGKRIGVDTATRMLE